MRKTLIFLAGLMVITGSFAVMACNGGGSSADTVVNVLMQDVGDGYTMVPDKTSVPAGTVQFEATNEGLIEHELLVLKLAEMGTDPGTLPQNDSPRELIEQEAGETAYIVAPDGTRIGEIIGEIEPEDLQAGDTNDVTFDLAAGDYVLLCNIETHYELGMWSMFTVT